MFGYVCDDNLGKRLNRAGINYWDVYLREINEQLGLHGTQLALNDLEDIKRLQSLKILLVGWQSGENLPASACDTLAQWVQQGGLLIGFGLQNLDQVFGIRNESAIKRAPDDYTISGYFDLQEHMLTKDVHSPLAPEQKLVIVSDIRRVVLNGAEEIGSLYDLNGKSLRFPAVTWQAYGKGFAGYFAFDVAKTVWLLHQGRPITKIPEGDPYGRTLHLQILGANSRKVAYADEILLLLQNMIGQYPLPFIYQIPPKEGQVTDALFIWGGDGCGLQGNEIATASNWMKSQGLPYHINVIYNREKQAFQGCTLADVQTLKANGHEISLHYDFTWTALTQDEVTRQNEQFVKQYGITPACTVNHCCCWTGWAEPAKWMCACGGKADNTFFPRYVLLKEPGSNGPAFGFGHGTAYPFFFYDDYRGNNNRIEFIEEPIINYELGHRGSVGDRKTGEPEKVREAVDFALRYHQTMDWLYHGVCIARHPVCREAIQEIFRYIAEKQASVVHMANNQLSEWWGSRSRSTVTDVKIEPDAVSCQCCCEYKSGMIVKMLLKRSLGGVVCDERISPIYKIKKEFAGNWLYVVVPEGKHSLKVMFG